jgi:hypothetical protein
MLNFKEPYNKDSALIFLGKFLPEDFRSFDEDVKIDFKAQFIHKIRKIGEAGSLENLHIYEIIHESENDPRVSLSKDSFRLLAHFGVRKALIFFVSKKSSNYRLSLVTVDLKWEKSTRIEKEYSNPRRYSFFLGPDARIHTPNDFLIKKQRVNNVEDLISRFDVELVTKEFFEKYRSLYEDIRDYLNKDHAFKNFSSRSDVNIDTFAKKLLGQIVFCYFLQRKGWLGASKSEPINNGDKDFMRALFTRSVQEKKDFFNDYLEYLFYDCLNRKADDGDYYREYFKCQIPFLNGGLFEPLQDYNWQKDFIHIPTRIFSNKDGSGVLDVFDLYNFTVYEDDPVDREVSVDPEMLGKVFENLLPENIRKGQGTYYTPREIVHYMCQESLINYLATDAKVDIGQVRDLVVNKHFDSQISAESLDKALQNIRVCDPACGSGAFLVGMLHEIVGARRMLNSKKDEYHLKKETIQDCIYGVDIDPGAIEIAKLRLWLSLVVDHELKDIEPLPNLDYKIMCGNSLLEELIMGDESIKLFDERLLNISKGNKTKKSLFDDKEFKSKSTSARNEYLESQLKEKQKQLIQLHSNNQLTHQKRKELEQEIGLLNKELHPKPKKQTMSYHPTLFGERAERIFNLLKELHKQYFTEYDPKRKREKRKQIENIEEEFIKSSIKEKVDDIEVRIENLNMQDISGRKLQKDLIKKKLEYLAIPQQIHNSQAKPYFLWKLNYFDVFQEKGGFDVVIANPPYISYGLRGAQKMEDDFKKMLRSLYPNSAEYKLSMYAIFMDRASQLCGANGIHSLIVPDSFLLGRYFSKIRKEISYKSKIIEILLLPYAAFDACVGFSVVYLFQRNEKNRIADHKITAKLATSNAEISHRSFRSFSYKQSYFEELKHNRFRLFFDQASKDLIAKIEKDSVDLGGIVKFSSGLIGKNGQDSIISRTKKGEKWIKGIISGGEINKYVIFPEGNYLLYDKTKIKSGYECVDYFKEKLFMRQTGDSLICAYDRDDLLALNNVHIGNLIDEKLSLRFITAIINSKILDYYYKSISLETGRAMAQTDIETVESLPIKKLTSVKQKPFIDIVDKILSITKSADYLTNALKQVKVKEYQRQIDQLAYEAYELTKDEIKIVENSTNIK